MQYNVAEGSNGSTILEVALPGIHKEQIKVTQLGSILKIEVIDLNPSKYIFRGIEIDKLMEIGLQPTQSVKYVSLRDGLLSILLSEDTKLELDFAIN